MAAPSEQAAKHAHGHDLALDLGPDDHVMHMSPSRPVSPRAAGSSTDHKAKFDAFSKRFEVSAARGHACGVLLSGGRVFPPGLPQDLGDAGERGRVGLQRDVHVGADRLRGRFAAGTRAPCWLSQARGVVGHSPDGPARR